MIASEVFGEEHPKYADTLIDYGFYLLNVDAISQGVKVYQVSVNAYHTSTFFLHSLSIL